MTSQAGNLFKMAKLWNEAGMAFVRSAECHEARGDARHDMAMQYAEAANCYRKVDPKAGRALCSPSFSLFTLSIVMKMNMPQ